MSDCVRASSSRSLRGEMVVPGDKSISHRALIFSALAVGTSRIDGLLESRDVLSTVSALRALGVHVQRQKSGMWTVEGVGLHGLQTPRTPLYLGNSGTSARLLMGLLAAQPLTTVLTGDSSLSARPMERVMIPLRNSGATFHSRPGGCLPIVVLGAREPLSIDYEMPVASAQVKSAILLSGLHARGESRILEPLPSRDHSERMLRIFGAKIATRPVGAIGHAQESARVGQTGNEIRLLGDALLHACALRVPGDISSAAFPLAASLLVSDSDIVLRDVGVNPLRTGLLRTFEDMGASMELRNLRTRNGEPVADIHSTTSALRGVVVPAERAPTMIDEYPILAVCAACAKGTTRLLGLAELRVKESDRLQAIVHGLQSCGVEVRYGEDWLEIEGAGESPLGGATIAANSDHRIAMAFLVLGMAAQRSVTVSGTSTIETSFPEFVDELTELGGSLRRVS